MLELMKEKGNKKSSGRRETQNKRLKAWRRRVERVRQGQRGEREQNDKLYYNFFSVITTFYLCENSNQQVRKLKLCPL